MIKNLKKKTRKIWLKKLALGSFLKMYVFKPLLKLLIKQNLIEFYNFFKYKEIYAYYSSSIYKYKRLI